MLVAGALLFLSVFSVLVLKVPGNSPQEYESGTTKLPFRAIYNLQSAFL